MTTPRIAGAAGSGTPRINSGLFKPVFAKREPAEEEYGTVAVFQDLYGNKWDLLQLRGPG